mmetsp:Transcript_14894/g.23084  ORF Transcript_14894/g.23084 Transcript_14894/m.23084 type:complete len:159 (-) Transcript_14894:593-1069(-)
MNQTEVDLNLLLFFMIQSLPYRFWVRTSVFIAMALAGIYAFKYFSTKFVIEKMVFFLSHCFVIFLLTLQGYHREMDARKNYNYLRILEIEVSKTSDLISKLIPLNTINSIMNQEKHVDQFDEVTLLFTDMVGFTAYTRNAANPNIVVDLLSRLFSRFD